MEIQGGKFSNLRRSQRVYIAVDVVVVWREPNDKSGSENTRTLVVNAHGALMPLRRPVQINDVLTLRNVTTGEELDCRVVDLSPVEQPGMKGVGVEFVEPTPLFWHIAFPPTDWTPRSPEAKGYRPHPGMGSGSKEAA